MEEKNDSTINVNDLKLDSFEQLQHSSRTTCSTCKKKYKYYCPQCRKPLGCIPPIIHLPLQVDIIHHPLEKVNKSTIFQLAVLCPNSVTIYESGIDSIPHFDPNESLFLYPSENSIEINEIPLSKLMTLKRLIVIDATWNKANSVFSDNPQLSSIPTIKLSKYKTLFWRYQYEGDEYLATIESVYYCLRDYLIRIGGKYHGEIDNILWFFSFQYEIIYKHYSSRPLSKKIGMTQIGKRLKNS